MPSPLVIGHRGFGGRYPENTLAAIRAAIRLGVDMVEVDVQQTRDRRLVVFHDADLRRLAGVPGLVRARTLAGLRRHRPDVPTLRQVLQTCRGKVGVLVEIKQADPRQVVQVIRRCRMTRQVIVFSFDARRVRAAGRAEPRLCCFGLADKAPALAARRRRWGPPPPRIAGWGLASRAVSPALVRRFHAAGLRLFAWTVNETRDLRRLAGWGVDGLITDYPDRARRILARSAAGSGPRRSRWSRRGIGRAPRAGS